MTDLVVGPRPAGRVPALVSVIIPARNSASTLAEQIDALWVQDHDGPWELILADNGSTDATTAVFAEEVRRAGRAGPPPWTEARVVDASDRPGPAHARNVAAAAAHGDLYCFCDADDVVEPSWISALTRAAADHHLVGGRLDLDALNSEQVRRWRPAPSAAVAAAPNFAPSGNLAMWADCFHALGGLDEDYLKSEDVDLSQRARAAGASLGFAPDAVVHYRLRSTLRGLAQQAYRGGWATVQMANDRPESGHRIGAGELARRLAWTIVRLPYLGMASRRGIWVRRSAELAGIGVALTGASIDRHRGRIR